MINNKFVNFLYPIAFIEPPIFSIVSAYGWIHLLFMYLKVILILYTLLRLFKCKDADLHKVFGLITSVWILQIIMTCINSGNIQLISISYLSTVAVCIWAYLLFKNNYVNGIITVANYLGFLTILNFLTMLIYPNGFVEAENWRGDIAYWLFGSENNLPGMIFPALVFLWLGYTYTKKTKYALFSLAASISIVLSTSATGLMGLVLFVILTLVQNRAIFNEGKGKSFITLRNGLYIIAITAFVMIAGENLSFMSFLIEDVLGKDMTFTGRADIWMRFWAAIIEAPLTGYGILDIENLRDSFNTSHQHDYYLHLIFQGGFITLFAFINLLDFCSRRLLKSNNENTKCVLVVGIISFLTMCLTEVYGDFIFITPFYIMLTAAMSSIYCPTLVSIKKH